MSNLVAAVAAYLPAIPKTPGGIVRMFGSVPRKQYEAEWVAANPTVKRSSALRSLQRYGLAGGASKKQRRTPSKEAISKMRMAIIARDFPARITVRGHIGYNDADMRLRTITVSQAPTDSGQRTGLGPDELRAIVAVAAVVDDGRTVLHNGQPVAVGGDGEGPHNGESIAHNIFTGWYFLERPQDITADGQKIARQSYHEQLRYEEDCVFTVAKVRD